MWGKMFVYMSLGLASNWPWGVLYVLVTGTEAGSEPGGGLWTLQLPITVFKKSSQVTLGPCVPRDGEPGWKCLCDSVSRHQ